MWRESYRYDVNGNRASKTTPWGTIVYTYDRDENLLSEKGLRREARYEYNGQDRMVYSEVTRHEERSRATSRYAYDALGRRTVSQDAGGSAMRTLYNGLGFEVIREGETFTDGTAKDSDFEKAGDNYAQFGSSPIP
ncbi:MAG: hypothetical protein LBK62_06315 [Treponema sp.]|nr:hypothetical protein [Treponema sp.]